MAHETYVDRASVLRETQPPLRPFWSARPILFGRNPTVNQPQTQHEHDGGGSILRRRQLRLSRGDEATKLAQRHRSANRCSASERAISSALPTGSRDSGCSSSELARARAARNAPSDNAYQGRREPKNYAMTAWFFLNENNRRKFLLSPDPYITRALSRKK
jgi:hypothetical protein